MSADQRRTYREDLADARDDLSRELAYALSAVNDLSWSLTRLTEIDGPQSLPVTNGITAAHRALLDAARHLPGADEPAPAGGLTTRARTLATERLAALPTRLAHTLAVGDAAARIAHLFPERHRDDLCAAAILHDIGYSPSIAESGLHQLDGARWLDRAGWPALVCYLVAHHSCATVEAHMRGLQTALLAAYPLLSEHSDLLTAITYSDMTTAPDGTGCTIDERLRDVAGRYQPHEAPAQAMKAAEPLLRTAVRAIETALAAVTSDNGEPFAGRAPA